MITAWIIEDEEPAARRLQRMIAETNAGISVEKTLRSIDETVSALQSGQPGLLFMDIHLADGSSFEIFKQTAVHCPVIFITAFDQYAIHAFKVNSIDYLLKPIKQEDLDAAVQKFKKLYGSKTGGNLQVEELLKLLQQNKKEYKQRFAVRYGEHLKTINTEDAAYFYTENKASFLVTKDNHRYIVDFNMDELETELDPAWFFRINRQFIISIGSIAEMLTWSKARVFIKLNPPSKLETIVSSERAADFKKWLDGSTA